MIKTVIFANYLANLQRFFLKFIIFQTLLLSDAYETTTTEAHCPSLAKHTGRTKTLPFVASVQHVRSVSLMIQCEECGMWHLLYSPIKLSSIARQGLVTILDDYTLTCGATLSGLELACSLSKVCIRDLQCMLQPIWEIVLLNELSSNLYSLLFRRQYGIPNVRIANIKSLWKEFEVNLIQGSFVSMLVCTWLLCLDCYHFVCHLLFRTIMCQQRSVYITHFLVYTK